MNQGTGRAFFKNGVNAFNSGAIRSVLLHFLCHPMAKWSITEEDCKDKDSMNRWLGAKLND